MDSEFEVVWAGRGPLPGMSGEGWVQIEAPVSGNWMPSHDTPKRKCVVCGQKFKANHQARCKRCRINGRTATEPLRVCVSCGKPVFTRKVIRCWSCRKLDTAYPCRCGAKLVGRCFHCHPRKRQERGPNHE